MWNGLISTQKVLDIIGEIGIIILYPLKQVGQECGTIDTPRSTTAPGGQLTV